MQPSFFSLWFEPWDVHKRINNFRKDTNTDLYLKNKPLNCAAALEANYFRSDAELNEGFRRLDRRAKTTLSFA